MTEVVSLTEVEAYFQLLEVYWLAECWCASLAIPTHIVFLYL